MTMLSKAMVLRPAISQNKLSIHEIDQKHVVLRVADSIDVVYGGYTVSIHNQDNKQASAHTYYA